MGVCRAMTADAQRLVIAAFLAFCRIGACFLLMPGISSVRVPVQVRLFVAIAVSFALLVHLWDFVAPFADPRPAVLLPRVAGELLVGGMIGLLARLYVLALQFTGTAIATVIGYQGVGGAGVEDSEPEGPLGQIIGFSALLLLFVFDFHHQIIRAIVGSYEAVPVGKSFDGRGALVDIADTLSSAFLVTLRLASPFLAYAILINLTVGFVNKLVPQIPVYFIAQPFIILGGLLLLYFGAATLLSLFADGFAPALFGN